MIRWEPESAARALPLVGWADGANARGIAALTAWTGENRRELLRRLVRHGALLFRGFGPVSAGELAEFVRALAGGPMLDYVGGASPRKGVKAHVFTSTETAAHYEIGQHHEGSYLPRMPRYIAFLCQTAAEMGGETPLADSRRVCQRLAPEILARFERAGVRYVNHLADGFGVGKSWQDQFRTEDRAALESMLRAEGYRFEWKPDGRLRTELTRPAVLPHVETGEKAWIAQADHWHPSGLTGDTRARLGRVLPESEFPMNASYGDGALIDETDLEAIRAAIRAEIRIFTWQAGDILFCDNHLVSHGRRPYTGRREVLVAMADPGPAGAP